MAETTADTAVVAAETPAQTQTPAQTAPAAPQQAASEPSKGNGAPLKSPLITDPAAFLARARERSGLKPREPSTTAKTEPVQPAAAPPPAVEQPKAEEKPKAGESPDEMAARLAKFSREEREASARRRAWEEEQTRAKAEWEERQKQHEGKLKQAELFEKVSKAIEAGDELGAIRLLKADINPSAFTLTLLGQLQEEDERTMSPAEVERMIAERLKTEQAAREKANEEAKKAAEEKQKAEGEKTLETAKDSYVSACKLEFSREKFPFIARRGLDRESIMKHAMSVRDDAGRLSPPLPEELLKHFEAKYRAEAEADGFMLVPRTAPKPPAPVTPSLNPSGLVNDSGGRVLTQKRTTLEDKRAEIRQKLRAGGTQT